MINTDLTPYDIMELLNQSDIQRLERMNKEKFVRECHQRKITFNQSKHVWRTWIGVPQKEVTRKEKDDLIDYLYEYYKRPKPTFQDVFEQMMEYRKSVLNRSDATIAKDRSEYNRYITNDLSQFIIEDISEDYIEQYVNDRSKELQLRERAMQSFVQLLKQVFKYALRHHIITVSPMQYFDIQNYYQNCDLTVKTSDEKIFTQDEIKSVKDTIIQLIHQEGYNPYYYAMLFSILTGVRGGEIPPLQWCDITEKGIHIYKQQRVKRVKGKKPEFEELLFTKNERKHPKNGRYFPVTLELKRLLDEIQQWHIELGIQDGYIFCMRNGDWISKENYCSNVYRICKKKCGLNVTNNHAFRMSLNSNVFIPMGLPVTVRAYLLGHTVETNERFYSHMKTDDLNDVKRMLDDSTLAIPSYSQQNIINFPNQKMPQSRINRAFASI